MYSIQTNRPFGVLLQLDLVLWMVLSKIQIKQGCVEVFASGLFPAFMHFLSS